MGPDGWVTLAAVAGAILTAAALDRACARHQRPANPVPAIPLDALLPRPPITDAALDRLAHLLVDEAMADVDPDLVAEFMRRGERRT